MPYRHRRTTFARRGPTRRNIWVVSTGVIVLAANTPKNVDLLSSLQVVGSSTLGITIIRHHLSVLPQFSAATDAVTIGTIVARATDVGTSQPDPVGQPTDTWSTLTKYFPNMSGAAVDSQTPYMVDNRARRRMKQQDERFLLAAVSTAANQLAYHSRVLVALP